MDDLRQKYLEAIAGAADEAALEDLRVAAVGKKGEVSLKMRELGRMTPEERQVAGVDPRDPGVGLVLARGVGDHSNTRYPFVQSEIT